MVDWNRDWNMMEVESQLLDGFGSIDAVNKYGCSCWSLAKTKVRNGTNELS
jgi:hypothetical protein